MVIGIDVPRDLHLPQITQALRAFGPFFRAGQHRQQQSGKDANDANNDQQFDEGKSSRFLGIAK